MFPISTYCVTAPAGVLAGEVPNRQSRANWPIKIINEAVKYDLSKGAEQAALGFIEVLEQAYAHIGRHPAAGSPRYAHELKPIRTALLAAGSVSSIWSFTSSATITSTFGVFCMDSAPFPSGCAGTTNDPDNRANIGGGIRA